MIIIKNRLIPIGKKFGAINLFGLLFVKRGVALSRELVNHERIHTAQMRELLFVGFYLMYVLEWLVRLVEHRGRNFEAYSAISFEKEAYAHGDDLSYLRRRPPFAQWR